ncbi:thioredoxin family protein [bacterium]|nr:MAG: thioredoxin family protein [bacterium]RIK65081.1 MAG: thioredoxin family protein [Planctomycetota bacterium]
MDKAAPDFTLKNAKGEEIKLASFKGKIVVLEWVNFDCPYVRKHYDAKDMVTLQKKYREKEVVWLQICSSAKGKQGHFEGDALKERIAKEGCDEAFYLLDEDGAVGGAYKARTTPAMYVIDKEGVLRYMGAIDSIRSAKQEDVAKATNYVSAALDELLAGKAVTTKETKSYG